MGYIINKNRKEMIDLKKLKHIYKFTSFFERNWNNSVIHYENDIDKLKNYVDITDYIENLKFFNSISDYYIINLDMREKILIVRQTQTQSKFSYFNKDNLFKKWNNCKLIVYESINNSWDNIWSELPKDTYNFSWNSDISKHLSFFLFHFIDITNDIYEVV